jgi:hypothetical protein
MVTLIVRSYIYVENSSYTISQKSKPSMYILIILIKLAVPKSLKKKSSGVNCHKFPEKISVL